MLLEHDVIDTGPDLHGILIAKNFYDLILIADVIEHVRQPKSLLKNLLPEYDFFQDEIEHQQYFHSQSLK